MDDEEWGARTKTHRCCAACAVQENGFCLGEHNVFERLCGDVGDPAAGGAARSTELQRQNKSGQVMEKNKLVQADVLAAETLEEGGNGKSLVERAPKKYRESARGDVRRNFGKKARRAADASDPGTCKTVTMRYVSDLCLHLHAACKEIKRYAHRMQGT